MQIDSYLTRLDTKGTPSGAVKVRVTIPFKTSHDWEGHWEDENRISRHRLINKRSKIAGEEQAGKE